MERIESRLLEINARITQLKEQEVIPKQKIEALKSQQYIEEMRVISIAQQIDELNKETKDLNVAKSVLTKLGD